MTTRTEEYLDAILPGYGATKMGWDTNGAAEFAAQALVHRRRPSACARLVRAQQEGKRHQTK
jgi:hypothetical protein